MSGLLIAAPALGQPPASLGTRLQQELQRFCRQHRLPAEGLGFAAAELNGGAEITAWQGDRFFVPASVAKLMSGAAALSALGPDFRFRTPLYLDGQLAGGLLQGNLALRGGGDPSTVSESLYRAAQDLRLAGLEKVAGDLLLDTTAFAAPDLLQSRTGGRAFDAPLSALSVNYNSLVLFVLPGAPGKAGRVLLDVPVPFYRVINKTLTRGPAADLWANIGSLSDGAVPVEVGGQIPPGAEAVRVTRGVRDPLGNYGAQWLAALAGAGIAVTGRVRAAALPPGAKEFYTLTSPPLPEVLRLMNAYSNNLIADQLLLVLGLEKEGAPATMEKGRRAALEALRGLGLADPGLILENGSGYSRQSRLSPRAMIRLFTALAADARLGPEFFSTLAIAGQEGTLQKRQVGQSARVRVRAKSGYLEGVHSLAGVVAGPARSLAFALFINSSRINLPQAKALEDKLLAEMTAELQGAADE